jgi:hypothetical protein
MALRRFVISINGVGNLLLWFFLLDPKPYLIDGFLTFYLFTISLSNLTINIQKKKKSSKYIIQCSAAMPMNIYPACKGPIPSHACPLNCLGNPLNEKNKIKHAIKNNKHD